MLNKIELENIIKKITENSSAKEIILFGSYAKGNATEESDIDLCVLLENGNYKKRDILKKIRKSLMVDYKYPLDLLLYTVDEFRERSELNITFENEIREKGIKVYG